MADISKLTQEAKDQLASLAIDMSKDPEARVIVHKQLKKGNGAYGATSLPDVELNDIRQEVRNEFAQQKQQTEAQRVKERLEAQRSGLVTSGRFKPEEVAEVEKVMEKYGISDYEAGAKVYSADVKPAAATPEIQGKTWELPTLKKEDLEDLAGYTRRKAHQVISEFNAKRA